MFIQSWSFTASAISATIVAKVGVAGLGAVLMVTPFAPVVLVLAGIAIAGTAAFTAVKMDNVLKDNAGNWYDGIMEALR